MEYRNFFFFFLYDTNIVGLNYFIDILEEVVERLLENNYI